MKIGIDARMYSSGFTGIGRYVFELIRNLALLKTEDEFVCFLNSAEFEKFKKPADNFRAVSVNARHYSFAEQTNFLSILHQEKLDLMHFTHFNAPIFYRGRSVVTIHDLTLSKFPGKKMTKPIHRMAYNLVLRRSVAHARKIIAVSEHTKQDLHEIFKTPFGKIQVIANGVGSEFRPAIPTGISRRQLIQKFGIYGGYLLYTGVWRNHKNLLGLLTSVAKLHQERDFKGQLVITGRADPVYAPQIFTAIKKLKLTDVVVFPGLVSDPELVSLYQSARAFVFPSFYEGFGLPPLEAMACGVPVAASNTSSIPEVCGKDNAAFFDPENTDEMAEQIWRVWNDEKLRATLRERGLRRVEDFSWVKMAREVLEVYHQAKE